MAAWTDTTGQRYTVADTEIRDARFSHQDEDGNLYAKALRGAHNEVVEVRYSPEGETSWRPLGSTDSAWQPA